MCLEQPTPVHTNSRVWREGLGSVKGSGRVGTGVGTGSPTTHVCPSGVDYLWSTVKTGLGTVVPESSTWREPEGGRGHPTWGSSPGDLGLLEDLFRSNQNRLLPSPRTSEGSPNGPPSPRESSSDSLPHSRPGPRGVRGSFVGTSEGDRRGPGSPTP